MLIKKHPTRVAIRFFPRQWEHLRLQIGVGQDHCSGSGARGVNTQKRGRDAKINKKQFKKSWLASIK